MHNNVTELTARDIMTPEVITVQLDDSVEEAAQLLLDARITGAPVIDRWGNAVGVFTLTHAVDQMNGNGDGPSGADNSDGDGPRPSGRNGINHDEEAFYRLDLRRRWPPQDLVREKLKDKKVGDVMTPRVHSVLDTSLLAEVTSCILDRCIHRIFVRDADNKLVGIITSMDLLRVLGDILEGKLAAQS